MQRCLKTKAASPIMLWGPGRSQAFARSPGHGAELINTALHGRLTAHIPSMLGEASLSRALRMCTRQL